MPFKLGKVLNLEPMLSAVFPMAKQNECDHKGGPVGFAGLLLRTAVYMYITVQMSLAFS